MEIDHNHNNYTLMVVAFKKAQDAFKKAELDSRNPHFNSRFSSLKAIMEACRGPLSENGFAIWQPVSSEGSDTFVETVLMHVTGKSISSGKMRIILVRQDMQAMGSAITYAKRYSLASLLGIVSDEDDDGNASAVSSVQNKNEATNRSRSL